MIIVLYISMLLLADSYWVGYGGSINYFPLDSNPSTTGDVRNITTSLSYSDIKHEYGVKRIFTRQDFNFFYPTIWQGKNYTPFFAYQKMEFKNSEYEIKKIGAGTYHFFDMEDGYLDLGLSLKKLSYRGLENVSKNVYDLGFLIRKKEYLAGFSFENLSGGYGTSRDGIAKGVSFSISRFIGDYSLGGVISQNRFEDKTTYLFGLSASHLIRTYRYGYFRVSTSINHSSDVNSLSFGIFYNRDVWEFSFSLSGMLNKPNYLNTSCGLTIYWGRQDVETEYEKIIKREIKYRKDLLEELSEAARREEKLRKNISELSAQTDELKYRIEMIEKELNKEKSDKERLIKEKEGVVKTLNAIVEKQKKEKEELENLEKKRQQEKINLIRKEFDREMEIYRKLKLENGSKQALINYLKKIVSTYQDSGIDISEATLELLKLSKE